MSDGRTEGGREREREKGRKEETYNEKRKRLNIMSVYHLPYLYRVQLFIPFPLRGHSRVLELWSSTLPYNGRRTPRDTRGSTDVSKDRVNGDPLLITVESE